MGGNGCAYLISKRNTTLFIYLFDCLFVCLLLLKVIYSQIGKLYVYGTSPVKGTYAPNIDFHF